MSIVKGKAKAKALIIAGTDTGVGKTAFCGGLAAALVQAGVDIGVMKPVESGCRREGGRLVASDALFLRGLALSGDEVRLVNPYALEQPLAPALAARTEGVDISIEVVKEAFLQLSLRHELMLIEGAGGMLSPLSAEWSLPDLALALDAPMVIVARNTLGTINHCLLSLHYARSRRIRIMGMVLNQVSPESGPVQETNPGAVRDWGKAPLLGVMPFLSEVNAGSLEKAVKENIDMQPILDWIRS